MGAVLSDKPVGPDDSEHPMLNYVESRRAIYLPVYSKLLKDHPMFLSLRQRLKSGENLLIVEVDGPHQESLDYYRKRYGVADDFIMDSTVHVNENSMRILLNDTKHPFGHGYCLAMALLGKANQWNKGLPVSVVGATTRHKRSITECQQQSVNNDRDPSKTKAKAMRTTSRHLPSTTPRSCGDEKREGAGVVVVSNGVVPSR